MGEGLDSRMWNKDAFSGVKSMILLMLVRIYCSSPLYIWNKKNEIALVLPSKPERKQVKNEDIERFDIGKFCSTQE